jgi:hypothetical protein
LPEELFVAAANDVKVFVTAGRHENASIHRPPTSGGAHRRDSNFDYSAIAELHRRSLFDYRRYFRIGENVRESADPILWQG